MLAARTKKFTLSDLRSARTSGAKVPMLTCYDFSTARLMQDAGVPMLLVGDSAANVILGHETTLPVSLEFMIELTAAVRRGAPLAYLVADMPFGSYAASAEQGVENVCRMMKLSACDCVKLEVASAHAEVVRRCADAGVAIMAHLGLRPQTVNVLGGYKYQGRTAVEAERIVLLAQEMQQAGASAILLEAVPPQVSAAVVEMTDVPVIGCGAGPACHGSVVVTQDALGLSPHRPRFVPQLGDAANVLKEMFAVYVRRVTCGDYPAREHQYEMPPEEQAKFAGRSR